jgi:protein-S-isoprenylcysteine O-methyltransferase Ste14
MVYVILGVLGIVIVHFCDPVAIRRLPLLKPIVWVSGAGLFIYATVMICLSTDKLLLPEWAGWLGWVLLIVSLGLLVFSLLINLPFRDTYVASGVGDRLVTTGFYALVRHPGVLWSVSLAVGLVLVSKSRLALAAALLFLALDVVVVVIQDRVFFRRMFTEYDRYSRTTPMLVPTGKSIQAFCASIRNARLSSHHRGGHTNVELG